MDNILEKIKQFKFAILALVLLLSGIFIYHSMQAHQAINNNNVVHSEKVSQKTANREKHPEGRASSKEVVVDIQGAVNKPGVYHMKDKSIVFDVIQTAGGMKDDADVKQINRAQKLTDAMQIYVPRVGEIKTVSSNKSADKGANNSVVNLNSAVVEDFKDVKGIGPKKAEKIIAYREKNGPFQKIDDLSKVGGFGPKTIDSLRDSLTV
ncbi:helix-hairpin-helix domain-containing protein [Companilactobacillus furfuricola]|uniref:helix-hairpin-helix domain-containing protein n=1 Tax=Companilactobacillus furfuricola TaxID=1462575 RepID=UPI000F76FC94|nr:helix-hairpin-helix domain-containing protein [Companilactobacillus furfuricola]